MARIIEKGQKDLIPRRRYYFVMESEMVAKKCEAEARIALLLGGLNEVRVEGKTIILEGPIADENNNIDSQMEKRLDVIANQIEERIKSYNPL